MLGRLVNTRTGEVFELGVVTKIGRAAGSDIVLASPMVSRQHAMVRLEDEHFWFYDLGSFNGSAVNGSRVLKGRRLRRGDLIEIASFTFRFEPEKGATQTLTSSDPESFDTIALVRAAPAVILVSDLQDFTQLSEGLSPENLAQTIGTWYRECARVIEGSGGSIDKFIGDAVLAYWLNPSAEIKARVASAARSLKEAAGLIPVHGLEGAESATCLRCGIALHTGEIAVGGIGGGERTLLGDSVNVAFRIEAMTRKLGVSIVASGSFIEGWPEAAAHFRSIGQHKIRGRSGQVELFVLEAGSDGDRGAGA